MLESIDCAHWNIALDSGKRIHFSPEVNRIAELTQCDEAEPLVILTQNEWPAFFTQTLLVALENGVADVGAFDGETSGLGSEMGADRKPYQIDGISHRRSLIEVIDTPDEAAFDVAPGAKVFDMEIADGEQARRPGQVRAYFRPELHPTIKGGAEEAKKITPHGGVFQAEISFVDLRPQGKPLLELARGFNDVHAGNDSGGENGKSNRARIRFRHRGTEKCRLCGQRLDTSIVLLESGMLAFSSYHL